jgi:hypothetical protein
VIGSFSGGFFFSFFGIDFLPFSGGSERSATALNKVLQRTEGAVVEMPTGRALLKFRPDCLDSPDCGPRGSSHCQMAGFTVDQAAWPMLANRCLRIKCMFGGHNLGLGGWRCCRIVAEDVEMMAPVNRIPKR